MTMKSDKKYGEESTCRFKIDMRNLTNFWAEHSKVSKSFTLIGSFRAKQIFFELKKYSRVMFDSTEDWCKM